MDDIDRISNRVCLVTCFGALAGVGTSLFKGSAMGRTVGFTAFSCALSGTACFGSERIASYFLRNCIAVGQKQQQDERGTNLNSWELTLGSHAIGGAIGGALLGALYTRRPVQGVLFFTPLMLLMGTGEKLFDDMRNERIERMLIHEQQQQQQQQQQVEKE